MGSWRTGDWEGGPRGSRGKRRSAILRWQIVMGPVGRERSKGKGDGEWIERWEGVKVVIECSRGGVGDESGMES